MAAVLALATAAVFGAADFFGGQAAKRARVLHVVAGSHVVGLVVALGAAPLLADVVTGRALALGALGGALGVLGVGLLYRRLAIGPMSVVAPLTALTSAVLPAAWGVLDGERLSGLAWAGVILALVAVGLVSVTEPSAASVDALPPVTVPVVAESLLAGVGFGGMFIAFDATDPDAAPWPIVGARLLTATVLLLLIWAIARRTGERLVPADRGAWRLIAAVGVLDTLATMTFLFATTVGDLALVSVLAALYPVSTVVLARLVLAERMTRTQGVGFAVAMVATELLVMG